MKKMKKEGKILIALVVILLLILIGLSAYFINKGNENSVPPKEKTVEDVLLEKGIKLVNKENFTSDANTLLEKGYNAEEVNNIYEFMSDNNLKKILQSDYTDLSSFYQISNFEFDKIERYNAYKTLKNLEMKQAVTEVNLNLDEPFYQTIETVDNENDITVLVNKSHALPSDYVPKNLVPIPSFPNLVIKEEAMSDFENLLAAAKLDNIIFIPYSTYRSYDYQEGLYNKYLQSDPVSVVDTYSARPGHSEHQTGLALDVRSDDHWYNLTDEDYEWMQNNSYKYGFIIRYPKDNSTITGYKEEPWHIRYIGIEHATKVHELNITYDEYYDIYLTKH